MTLSLIDDFIANPTDWMTVKRIVQDVHGLARKAQKFELTASAVEITAQTINNDPLQLLEKPSAPFPLTWIEWNHSLLLSWLGGQSTAPPGAYHRQHGVLIHGETVYMVSRNQDETNRPTVWPMRFFLNRPTTNPTILTELHFWGNSYKNLPSGRSVKLSDLHSMEHIFHAARAQTVQDMSLRETMGDLRIILGILHTLNRKGAIVDGGTTSSTARSFPVNASCAMPKALSRSILPWNDPSSTHRPNQRGSAENCSNVVAASSRTMPPDLAPIKAAIMPGSPWKALDAPHDPMNATSAMPAAARNGGGEPTSVILRRRIPIRSKRSFNLS